MVLQRTAPLLLSLLLSCGHQVTQVVADGGGGAAPTTPSSSTTSSTTTTTSGSSSQKPCGPGNPPCPPTEYCGQVDCDGPGICLLRPSGCNEDCPGVCGCDGSTYCNDCLAQSQGVDVGPAGLCGSDDVVYRALLWLGGMDHLVIMRANYSDGTCLRLYADWPAEGSYGINAPDGWGVNAIVASDDLIHCLDEEQLTGQLVDALAASGTIGWQVDPGMYYPCALDLDVVVSFDPAPAWLEPMVSLLVSDLPVEGGCF